MSGGSSDVVGVGMEALVGNLIQVRDLKLEAVHCSPRQMLSIGRLGRLQSLELTVDSHYNSECNLRMLMNVIMECRSLVTLKVSRLGDCIILPPNKNQQPSLSYPSPHQPPSVSTSVLSRLGRALRIKPSQTLPRPNRPSKDLSAKEPWRKFVRDTTIPLQNSPENSLYRPLESTSSYPLLSRLHLSKIMTSLTADENQTGLEILFRKTPLLDDLCFDTKLVRSRHLACCLDAITETCHLLQSLELIHLQPSTKHPYSNMDSIYRFFKQHRPELKVLRLKSCMGLEPVVDLIPLATVARLERVSFEYTLYSHEILHRFMTRCSNLQYFTWTVESTSTPPPPRHSHPLVPLPSPTNVSENHQRQISAFLDPWACTKTIRHIEQTHAIQDQDSESFDFYYNYRLVQMERLVSLGCSILDIRKSMQVAGMSGEEGERERGEGGSFHDISRGEVDSQAPYARVVRRRQRDRELECVVAWDQQEVPVLRASLPTTGIETAATGSSSLIAEEQDVENQEHRHQNNITDNHTDKDATHHYPQEEEWKGWHLKTVQELILGPINTHPHSHLLDIRQLTISEIQYLLRAFPKLRKIRYRGRIFPLDYEARTFLDELEQPRVLVIHVSQGGGSIM